MKMERNKCVSAVLCKTTCSAAVPLNLRTFQRPSRSSALQRPSRSADMLSGNAAQSTHVSAAEPLKRHTHVYVCVYPDAQMISTLSSTAEGPKTRRSGKAAQSSYFSAAEPLKQHMYHILFVCINTCIYMYRSVHTPAATPLNLRTFQRPSRSSDMLSGNAAQST